MMKISRSAMLCALLSLSSMGTGHVLAQQDRQTGKNSQNQPAASASPSANENQQRQQVESKAEESPAGNDQSGSEDNGLENKEQQQQKVLKIHELKNIQASALMAVLRQATTPGQATYVSGYRGATPNVSGAGGMPGAGGGLSIAANDDSKLIFLRGPQKQVDDAMKMITYLDSKDNNEPLKLDGTTLIPVKQEHYAALTTVIQGLGLSSRFTSAGSNAFIIIEDGEDEAKRQDAEQVMQIVEKLTGALSHQDQSSESNTDQARADSDSASGQQQSPENSDNEQANSGGASEEKQGESEEDDAQQQSDSQ